MPNWCNNHITIESDNIDALRALDAIMSAPNPDDTDGDSDGQFMNLLPMPAVLGNTRSPAPSGEYDPDGRIHARINDPQYPAWTVEYYEQERQAHDAAVQRADQAEKETGSRDWYDWSVEHWGTKWSMETQTYNFNPEHGVITISGDTAWSPPIPLCSTVSGQHNVTVTITFQEEGMGFIGAAVCVAGSVFESSGDIDFVPEGLDWDHPNVHEAHNTAIGELLDMHTVIARHLANLIAFDDTQLHILNQVDGIWPFQTVSYTHSGITDVDDVAALHSTHISGFDAGLYREAGITNITDMCTLTDERINGFEAGLYAMAGIANVTDMTLLKQADINGELVADYSDAGITDPHIIIATHPVRLAEGVTADELPAINTTLNSYGEFGARLRAAHPLPITTLAAIERAKTVQPMLEALSDRDLHAVAVIIECAEHASVDDIRRIINGFIT